MISPKVCKECCQRQVLKVAKLLDIDPTSVLDKFNQKMQSEAFETAPECAEFIFDEFRKISLVDDPYKKIKDDQNKKALEILPKIKKMLNSTGIEQMINLAITGNMIDYGVFDNIDVQESILKIINKEFYRYDFDEFKNSINEANSILYVTDNAGEFVYDLEFMNYLVGTGKKVYLLARGGPAINDITVEDLKSFKLNPLINVVHGAASTPGLVLKKSSPQVLDLFYKVDLIISKGQGNFETLYNLDKKPKNLFFLFVAKCYVVADFLNAPSNSKFLLKA